MSITINGGGTITGISSGGLPAGSVTTATLADGAATGSKLGAGSIIQVIQTYRTSTFEEEVTVGNFSSAVMTGSITPTSTSNKLLVLCTLHISTGSASSNATNGCQALIKRDGTGIGVGDAAGNRVRSTGAGIGSANTNRLQSNVHMTFLDSPSSTSALSYTAHIKPGFNGSQYVNLNREQSDGDLSSVGRSASSITLMEVAA